MYKKITTTTTTEEHSDTPTNGTQQSAKMYIHCIRVDAPLMIKILEWAREESTTDDSLHVIVGKMLEESSDGSVLTMEDYEELVPVKTEEVPQIM
jgi:hypothetical protein